MSFHSGRVTFCRFAVMGDAPPSVDETALGTLKDHAFAAREVGTPDQVEAGFITGSHLYDTQFSYETNAYGNPPGSLLLLALRIDTHQVPSEVKQAYKAIEERAVAAENPSGFASRAQKRDAADVVDRKLHDEIAEGKYRKSKSIPVLWDLAGRQLYLGATSNVAMEEISKLMSNAFAVELRLLTSGALAEDVLGANKRDFEDLSPSPFTAPPRDAREPHDDGEEEGASKDIAIPLTPWVHAAGNTRDFLGNELLIWLWWQLESGTNVVTVPTMAGGERTGRKSRIAVVIDRTLDMDCAWDATGKQSLRGPKPTHLPEAGEALASGKWPRKAGLILADAEDETQWELALQGDKWIVSGAALPKVEEATSPREITDQRLQSTLRLAGVVDGLFHTFMEERLGKGWGTKRDAMREWIKARRKRK
jgi:hypothetical protein